LFINPLFFFLSFKPLVKFKNDYGLSIIDTKGRQKRSSAVRRSGKAQAEEQFIDSSNAVNQNNHNINENCAQFGRGMKIYFVQFLLFC
jgi:hypothetical protein